MIILLPIFINWVEVLSISYDIYIYFQWSVLKNNLLQLN